MDACKDYADEASINAAEKIEDGLRAEVDGLREQVENIKGELSKKMDKILRKNRKKISKIKDVCTSYFDNYDGNLKHISSQVKNVM